MSAQLTIDGEITVSSNDIIRALMAKFPHPKRQSGLNQDGNISFGELRIGTGYGKDAEQRIDFWTMHPLPSKGFVRQAFEVKVTRGDFLREMRQPRKRAYALLYSNEFYFAVPKGLIDPGELPPEAGLYEYGRYADGEPHLYCTVAAPWRDTPPPSWRFFAAVTRRALGVTA